MPQDPVARSLDGQVADGDVTELVLDRSQFVLAEYAALRAEILKQIEIQYQLVGLNLLVFGAALSIAFQSRSSATASLYPVVALFLAFCWISATHEIERCGQYIKDHIETHVGRHGWENYLARTGVRRRFWWRWRGSLGMRGSFVATSTIAVIASVSLSRWQAPELMLLVSGALALLIGVVVMLAQRKDSWVHSLELGP